MFRSLFRDHLQGSSSVLSALITFQLPASSFVVFGYVAVCHLFVCVRCTCLCTVWSFHDVQFEAMLKKLKGLLSVQIK
jgi:hypothetical protein